MADHFAVLQKRKIINETEKKDLCNFKPYKLNTELCCRSKQPAKINLHAASCAKQVQTLAWNAKFK